MPLNQPVSQVRFTNVAAVRYKRNGKRFEIVCYKNKVVNYRNGVEEDLDEVLQSDAIFLNSQKGVLASKDDLRKAFNTTDNVEICKIILTKGDVQISEKERSFLIQNVLKDVATIVVEMCVNPTSKRPYSYNMILRYLKTVNFIPDMKKGAKQQALGVIPKLSKVIPLVRARMKVLVTLTKTAGKDDIILSLSPNVEKVKDKVYLIPPGLYQRIHDDMQDSVSSIEVLDLNVQETGTASIQEEMSKLYESEAKPVAATATVPATKTPLVKPTAAGKGCSTCGGSFAKDEYRAHFRTDFHRYNLKLKARSQPIMSQEEFDAMSSLDVDEFFKTLEV